MGRRIEDKKWQEVDVFKRSWTGPHRPPVSFHLYAHLSRSRAQSSRSDRRPPLMSAEMLDLRVDPAPGSASLVDPQVLSAN
jgi:hypothetical protein